MSSFLEEVEVAFRECDLGCSWIVQAFVVRLRLRLRWWGEEMKWCCRLIEVSRETVFWKVSKQITGVGCVSITAFWTATGLYYAWMFGMWVITADNSEPKIPLLTRRNPLSCVRTFASLHVMKACLHVLDFSLRWQICAMLFLMLCYAPDLWKKKEEFSQRPCRR